MGSEEVLEADEEEVEAHETIQAVTIRTVVASPRCISTKFSIERRDS